ncbi:radical SAM protein [Chitinilyticum piscinae]|uniref:Radical SAM protein n=1 Tax=Chitinilyticum piscinae TaxID=2866724 RepID=A0A8J7K1X9_9NEIS|nr:radical SAM protein [Chitinilyticum piscinae]MBE9609836.1 radical SAM protein [Chitinilyticum piscinae]
MSEQDKQAVLSVTDHRRDSAGFTYVYPVVSRRAGGVSVGINLNPNNACNWRCVYCQVPDLQRGSAPELDLVQLHDELVAMLDDILHGDFMQTRVPEGARRLNDIAFSGNGEPTSSHQFPAVVELVARVLQQFGLQGNIKLVLITNGSLMHRAEITQALGQLAELGGEVWFKLDRAPADGFSAVNQVALQCDGVARRLAAAAKKCPTWLQTCMFAMDGRLPDDAEIDAYLAFLAGQQAAGLRLRGVLLYGLARPSLQAEAARLSPAPAAWMQALAGRIESLGLPVRLSV